MFWFDSTSGAGFLGRMMRKKKQLDGHPIVSGHPIVFGLKLTAQFFKPAPGTQGVSMYRMGWDEDEKDDSPTEDPLISFTKKTRLQQIELMMCQIYG